MHWGISCKNNATKNPPPVTCWFTTRYARGMLVFLLSVCFCVSFFCEFLFAMILTELEDAVGKENCSTRAIDKATHSVDYYWLSRMWADRGERMPEADIVVCPTFVCLPAAVEAAKGSNVKVGAQNIHWADNGAFTGEISGEMLKNIGVEYVIVLSHCSFLLWQK